MLKDILYVISGILSVLIFIGIKKVVTKQTTKIIKETFDKTKAVDGLTNVTDKVLWMKDIVQLFNFRKLIIYFSIFGIVAGVVYGYGFYKGKSGVQPVLNWRGKEEWVALNEHYLHIKPDGTLEVVDTDKKTVLKKITVKDLDILRKNTRPYGFDLKAFVCAGGSLGETGAKVEAGVGMQWLKWYKWYVNSFITNIGLYPAGISYKITENFDLLAGVGWGYKGDQRIFIGGKWRF